MMYPIHCTSFCMNDMCECTCYLPLIEVMLLGLLSATTRSISHGQAAKSCKCMVMGVLCIMWWKCSLIQLLHCLAATFCSQPVHLNRWYGNLRQEFCNESIHLQPAILWFHRCSEVIYFNHHLAWKGQNLLPRSCYVLLFHVLAGQLFQTILGWVWLVWLWVICI